VRLLKREWHLVLKDKRGRCIKEFTRVFLKRDDALAAFKYQVEEMNSALGSNFVGWELLKPVRYICMEVRYSYGEGEVEEGHPGVPTAAC
jgi:hypothetical protein